MSGESRKSGQDRRLPAALLLAAAVTLAGCASLPGGSTGYYRPSVTWNDTRWCVPLRLKIALMKVSRRFGPVTVHSTHRWPFENWRKGGKPRSFHLTCRATDFSVAGDAGGVLEYLRSLPEVGGYARYPQGFFHIDTGPRRTW
jgi:hypothetical protein